VTPALSQLVVAWHPPAMWVLRERLIFTSRTGVVVRVPVGFRTDLASVPRLPGLYITLGGLAHAPAAMHDYLYHVGWLSRKESDLLFLEACELVGVPQWKANLLYFGVRLFGWARYRRSQ